MLTDDSILPSADFLFTPREKYSKIPIYNDIPSIPTPDTQFTPFHTAL